MIELLQFTLPRLLAIRDDPTRLGDLAVVDDGLPPSFIVDQAIAALKAGREPLWWAPLAFVERPAARVVGSAIFKGEPDDGWVEIGYGVARDCRRRGFATDGVFAMVRLAFAQSSVSTVYAETEATNDASRRVVEKVGFTHAGRRLDDDDGLVDCWFVEAR